MSMNVAAYMRTYDLPAHESEVGGQALILGEVVASLHPAKTVWVPFRSQCGLLIAKLTELGIEVYADEMSPYPAAEMWAVPDTDAVYFGTPTIVDDQPLFESRTGTWTKTSERATVTAIMARCHQAGIRRVVCGLGTGDINIGERLEDIGGNRGSVVCTKKFEGFTDYVLRRDL